MSEKIRCGWAGNTQIYIDYHDNEWGRPVHNDDKLFEMLILETMQAGLSWITVLKKERLIERPLMDLTLKRWHYMTIRKLKNSWQMRES